MHHVPIDRVDVTIVRALDTWLLETVVLVSQNRDCVQNNIRHLVYIAS